MYLQCTFLDICDAWYHLLQAAWSNYLTSPSCGLAMFDATHFLRALQGLCTLLNRPSPVIGIEDEGQWTRLNLRPGAMQAPTARSFKVAAAGTVDMRSSIGQCSMSKVWMDQPSTFYHGTSPETLLLILLEGQLASAGNLGIEAHTPDGVYSYSCKEASAASCYVQQGCQIEFTAAYFPLSRTDSDRVKVVPEGVACRKYRSAYQTFGSRGIEWVFNPRSCGIKGVRVLTEKTPCLMQALATSMADLAAEMWPPVLAVSSTSLSPSSATCSSQPRQPLAQARSPIHDHMLFSRLQVALRVCVCVAVAALSVHMICIRQLLFHLHVCLHQMRSMIIDTCWCCI